MSKSKISWTDETWNTVTGCTKISEGCRNCYAETLHGRLTAMGLKKYAYDFDVVSIHTEEIVKPLRWNKPRMVFVNSMSDSFHSDVPVEFLHEMFMTMRQTPQHTYQILTKRPMSMVEYYARYVPVEYPIDNIWLGVTVENRDEVWRIAALRKIPAKVRFLSIEPLLGSINLDDLTGIHWVIVGCESGIGRRACKTEWIESIIAQCKAQNVAVFVKQINENGKVVKDINAFPLHLQIQEYPYKNSTNG